MNLRWINLKDLEISKGIEKCSGNKAEIEPEKSESSVRDRGVYDVWGDAVLTRALHWVGRVKVN